MFLSELERPSPPCTTIPHVVFKQMKHYIYW